MIVRLSDNTTDRNDELRRRIEAVLHARVVEFDEGEKALFHLLHVGDYKSVVKYETLASVTIAYGGDKHYSILDERTPPELFLIKHRVLDREPLEAGELEELAEFAVRIRELNPVEEKKLIQYTRSRAEGEYVPPCHVPECLLAPGVGPLVQGRRTAVRLLGTLWRSLEGEDIEGDEVTKHVEQLEHVLVNCPQRFEKVLTRVTKYIQQDEPTIESLRDLRDELLGNEEECMSGLLSEDGESSMQI